MDKWLGMSDREAFIDLLSSVKKTIAYAHRMRGNTSDENLVENIIWKLEENVGQNKD